MTSVNQSRFMKMLLVDTSHHVMLQPAAV